MIENNETLSFKTVIPAAGLGTRLLPATKEQPKEMLPVFERTPNAIIVKPFLQVVFEKLFDSGSRDFCFVVGRGKRSIEDHFTLDNSFLYQLAATNKIEPLNELSNFYGKVNRSNIVFVNQPEPRGFGDAVFRARGFIGKNPFIVHAGDDLIISAKNQYIKRLIDKFQENEADAVFFVQKIKNPEKYGVIQAKKVSKNFYRVMGVKEKPKIPASNLAIVAIYVFSSKIIEAIQLANPNKNEIELTDAIQHLIDQDCPVYALELRKNERRIDIGTPESYWNVLKTLQRLSSAHLKPSSLRALQADMPIVSDNSGSIQINTLNSICPKSAR